MTRTFSHTRHLLGATALTAIFSLSIGAVSSYAATPKTKASEAAPGITKTVSTRTVTQTAQLSPQERRNRSIDRSDSKTRSPAYRNSRTDSSNSRNTSSRSSQTTQRSQPSRTQPTRTTNTQTTTTRTHPTRTRPTRTVTTPTRTVTTRSTTTRDTTSRNNTARNNTARNNTVSNNTSRSNNARNNSTSRNTSTRIYDNTRRGASSSRSNSNLSNAIRSVILSNSRNYRSRSNTSRSSSYYNPRIASHSFGRFIPTNWSNYHNGFRNSYRSSIGISFSFGSPGYSQYRWAPSQYGLYRANYGSFYSYRAQTQCQRIVIDGIYRGYLTPISVVECYNPWDGHYILQGTEHVEASYSHYSYNTGYHY